ncbi:YdbH domain-containing protein [Vogesella sp. LIG4]|uniref:intermembrane phospholipid transport protein YdbH family protein n=1 Tax=Vogesella sp. LIG4 TaxID=1192162 RepID=UPI00082005CD|nr:YdbH domain-containing protein [Vogesella sp. LIG4]SCK30859.1 Dicarboxylate transport [Vogesella sp. LIG4]
MSNSQPPAPPEPPRRRRYWLAAAVLLLLLLPLAAALGGYYWLQRQGLQLAGLGWQQGPRVTQWQWRQQGCLAADGQGMHIAGWQPLRIELQQLTLHSCGQPSARHELPAPPPAGLPPFSLHIASLRLAALPSLPLPPLQLALQQADGHWQLQAQQHGNSVTADYQRGSGQWQASARLQAATLDTRLLGELALHGSGRWLPGDLQAQLQADGRQLGYQGAPQRADARLQLQLAQRRWQLAASLAQPLALPAGWLLQPGQVLQASGDLDAVHKLQADLQAHGPQGKLALQLTPDSQSLQRGSGQLRLDGKDLQARIPLRWADKQLTLAAGSLHLPQGALLSWPHDWQLPLAAAGNSRLPFRLQYQGLQLQSDDSAIRWGNGDWQWQGALALAGRYAGYRLQGNWQGRVGPQGAHGTPLTLDVQAPQLQLHASLPVNGIDPRQPRLSAELSGHYQDWPLHGKLGAQQQGQRWLGSIAADSRLPFYSQGGELQLAANWQGQPGHWQLDAGSSLAIGQGLLNGVLLKPVKLQASSALLSDGQGASGKLQLDAGGAVASRWSLPAANGELTLAGSQASASLQLPAWRSKLQLHARRQGDGASGSVDIDTPLSPAMSRGLGVTLQQGQLNGQLQWAWGRQWQLNGNASVGSLALDWGGILASGGKGRLTLAASPAGISVQSDGPLQLAQLDVGTLVQNVSLQLRSDLQDWQLSDVHASVLGGSVAAEQLRWPSTGFQPVSVHHIDLAAIAALQNDPQPTVQLTGLVGGTLPVQLLSAGVALQGGLLRNEGELTLRVPATAGVTAMAQSNRAVQLALDMLSELDVNDFQARLDMTPVGVLDALVTLKGVNPKQNRQPVVLNYSHSENVLELLRSLRIGDEISRRVLNRKPAAGTRNPVTESKP